jgi:hypothetical protein
MSKYLSKVKLSIGQDGTVPPIAPAGDTFDLIGNLTAVGGPSVTKGEIEHTDMESTVKEFFGDLPDNGEMTFTAQRNVGDLGQAAAFADSQAQTQRNIEVIWLDPSDDSVVETYDFVGEVMDWNQDASIGSTLTVNGRIKIVGAITVT